MDFFEQQRQARRSTFWLLALFILAMACIVLAVYGVALLVSFAWHMNATFPWWNPAVFFWAGGGTLLVILAGSLWKIRQLSGGGLEIAYMLGSDEVPPNTRDAAERRLLNVVEEMAIAAGLPVPLVFVMEEDGINTLVAGLTPADAVLVVSRGCMRALSRDELQGVIGHEFSHILNGDMMLNLRMVGVLHGILLIALIGAGLLYEPTPARKRAAYCLRQWSRNNSGAFITGIVLLVIGSIGVFFARLIQAAVSRQRERLADAAAVQFTRNPAGLAGALKKIAGFAATSWIRSPNALAVRHMFFAEGVPAWTKLFATHPPLEARIRWLDPTFDGKIAPYFSDYTDPAIAAVEPRYDAPPPMIPGRPPAAPRNIPCTPGAVLSQVGALLPAHLNHAHSILAAMPLTLIQAVHEPAGADQVVYGLLLAPDAALRERQYTALARAGVSPATRAKLRDEAAMFLGLPAMGKLPLAQIAIPALRRLPAAEKACFLAATRAMVDADDRLDLFECMLCRLVDRQLGTAATGRRLTATRLLRPPLADACQRVLSELAWNGAATPEAARQAFAAGVRKLAATPPPELLPAQARNLAELDGALQTLETAGPALRQRLLAAGIAIVSADGFATEAEAELLRALADSFGCPLPLLSATPGR
ncbi:MAG: M48 family metallopeptidase [Lentisphaeria bacterium]